MNPKVSIVMPVYNCEKYISEALDSLLNQRYQNFEVICVDDGSTDSSADILNNYAKNDSRIFLIKQKNQYAGVARNNGMKKATGKYLMFLDADDVFEKNMLSTLVRIAEKKKTDIIYFGFYEFKTSIKERSLMGIPYHSRKVCSPLDHKEDIFYIANGLPWNKLYKRDFVIQTGIHFQDIKSDNDQLFTRTVVLEADKLFFSNKRLIDHRIDINDSLQGSYRVDSGNLALSTIAIYEMLLQRQNYNIYRESFERYVIRRYLSTFDKCQTYESFKTLCDSMKESFEKTNINCETKAIQNHPAQEFWDAILEGNNEERLFNLYKYMRTNYSPKYSIEYKIGKRILKMFRVKSYF